MSASTLGLDILAPLQSLVKSGERSARTGADLPPVRRWR
jgi:hypothetical protein